MRERAVKRPPIPSLDGAELASLEGRMLEVELDGHVLRFGANRAFWWPQRKCVVAFQGIPRGRKVKQEVSGKARKTFERWTGRTQRFTTSTRVPGIKGKWVSFGRTRRYDYYSTKWNRAGTEYTHDTTTGPTLFRFGGSKPPWIWVLRGGGLQLTARGLIG